MKIARKCIEINENQFKILKFHCFLLQYGHVWPFMAIHMPIYGHTEEQGIPWKTRTLTEQ
jgi:hypothetical protein